MSKGRIQKRDVTEYNFEIIKLALEHTVDSYGPFNLTQLQSQISDLRALHELSEPGRDGKIDVHIAIASKEREAMAHAIKIPIRFALLSYRLVLVKREQLKKFSHITSLSDLREFSTGSGENWVTTEILRQQNFQIAYVQNFYSIFKMLEKERFDFVLRGVNEIFFEKNLYAKDFENLAIVPNIAVYMPTHYYAFVNKSDTRLASRIEEGLRLAFEDGSAKALFWEHYGASIDMADLASRRIIGIENQNLINAPVTRDVNFWYAHSDEVKELIMSHSR